MAASYGVVGLPYLQRCHACVVTSNAAHNSVLKGLHKCYNTYISARGFTNISVFSLELCAFGSCAYISVKPLTVAEPEPADLQWSGQKIRLNFNLLMCYGITSLSILCSLVCMGIHSYNSIII